MRAFLVEEKTIVLAGGVGGEMYDFEMVED